MVIGHIKRKWATLPWQDDNCSLLLSVSLLILLFNFMIDDCRPRQNNGQIILGWPTPSSSLKTLSQRIRGEPSFLTQQISSMYMSANCLVCLLGRRSGRQTRPKHTYPSTVSAARTWFGQRYWPIDTRFIDNVCQKCQHWPADWSVLLCHMVLLFLKIKMYGCLMMMCTNASKVSSVLIKLGSIWISFADRGVDKGCLFYLKSLVIKN